MYKVNKIQRAQGSLWLKWHWIKAKWIAFKFGPPVLFLLSLRSLPMWLSSHNPKFKVVVGVDMSSWANHVIDWQPGLQGAFCLLPSTSDHRRRTVNEINLFLFTGGESGLASVHLILWGHAKCEHKIKGRQKGHTKWVKTSTDLICHSMTWVLFCFW